MYLTLNDLRELRGLLHAARQLVVESGHEKGTCHELLLTKDGAAYRLEPKPNAQYDRLAKANHEVVEVDGVLHVKVPLGVHGIDYLGVDPDTKEIVCTLCGKAVS